MRMTRNEIRHCGFDVLIKENKKDSKFETVEVGLPSRDAAHEFVTKNYPKSKYRIEGRRINYTPKEYIFEKKDKANEEAN